MLNINNLKSINLRKSTKEEECCCTCEYWYDTYGDSHCQNNNIDWGKDFDYTDSVYTHYGIEDGEYTCRDDVCDLYKKKKSSNITKIADNGDWVKVIKGKYKDTIGKVDGCSNINLRLHCIDYFTDYIPQNYVEVIQNPDDVVPFAKMKMYFTKNEYNKLIEDHDKYCENGECDKCYCSLGESINPKIDEICLYNFIETV